MPCRRFDRSSGSSSHRRVLTTFQTSVVLTKYTYLPFGVLDNEDKNTATFRNVVNYLPVDTKQYPRIFQSSIILHFELFPVKFYCGCKQHDIYTEVKSAHSVNLETRWTGKLDRSSGRFDPLKFFLIWSPEEEKYRKIAVCWYVTTCRLLDMYQIYWDRVFKSLF